MCRIEVDPASCNDARTVAGTGAACVFAGTTSAAQSASPSAAGEVSKTIAIQLDSIAPANEGVERVLDEIQQRASVNVLMIDSLWFSPNVTAADLAKENLH